MKVLVVGFFVAVAFLNLASTAMAGFKTIEGTATYRQRIAIRPGSILEVELRDVSRADAPAPLLSAVSVKAQGQVPIAFKLLYHDGMIDDRHTYAMSAKLRLKDRIMSRSTTTYAVLTRGKPDKVDIVMDMMPGQSSREALFGLTWRAEDIGGSRVMDIAQSTIKFEPDGSVSGSGGCNKFSGRAKIRGNRLEIGSLAATSRACAAALMNQEKKFFDLLEKARTFQVDTRTGELVLRDESDIPLAKFLQREDR